ncbi:MAG: hypothetical protein OEV15_07760, partial [Gallionella sp.]|nr:hypothetical protein [Gallionella sp.]
MLAAPAFAQTDAERINELERKLERSLKMLDDLSSKIDKMEADKKEASGGVLDANSRSDTNSRLETVEQQVSQMVTGMAGSSGSGHEDEEVLLHGFADVGFASNSEGNPAANPKGFNVGSFNIFLTPQFGDNVKALVELAFEVHKDGSAETDLERVQAGYTFSDMSTVWAGRFHTPYGYWNTAFHHGVQIQTSIMRPRFLDFEEHSGILPAHMVGVWATGKVKAGDGRLTYDAFVGNGPKIKVVDPGSPTQTAGVLNPNMAGDDNHSAMVGLNVGYEIYGSLDGLRVAGHWFKGDVDDNAVNPAGRFNRTSVNMAGGSAVYLANDLEVLSEYYRFNNKDKSGTTGTHKSWAGYLQVGKNFTNTTPFVRLEKTVLS